MFMNRMNPAKFSLLFIGMVFLCIAGYKVWKQYLYAQPLEKPQLGAIPNYSVYSQPSVRKLDLASPLPPGFKWHEQQVKDFYLYSADVADFSESHIGVMIGHVPLPLSWFQPKLFPSPNTNARDGVIGGKAITWRIYTQPYPHNFYQDTYFKDFGSDSGKIRIETYCWVYSDHIDEYKSLVESMKNIRWIENK